MLRTTTKLTLRAPFTPLRLCLQKRFYDEKPTQHATEKTHSLDVQSDATKRGMAERQQSKESKETRGKKQDPKKEHPEAPGPVIGMEDERGHSMSTM